MGSEGPQVCKIRALQIAMFLEYGTRTILVELRGVEPLSCQSRLRGFPASRNHPVPPPL